MLLLSKYAKGLVAGVGGAATLAFGYADLLCNTYVPLAVGVLTALGVVIMPNRGVGERGDSNHGAAT